VTAPEKPLLVYDGDCGFCRKWVMRWRRRIGDRLDYAPFQQVAERFPEIPPERFRHAVHLRLADGRWARGAEAVFLSLSHAPGGGALRWMYERVPGFAAVSEGCYRLVAGHRAGFDRLTDRLWGPHLVPPGETVTAWLFLRLLGVIYLVAFVSLWSQIAGLCGSHGILPAGELMRAMGEHYGASRFWMLPTLCWFGAGDGALQALCATGTALAALLAIGVLPAPSLIGLWAIYLSLATVCREFLWFQWDGLLLEAGFLALFLAPWRWWSRPRSDPPPRVGVWLLRWLLFRLMVSSAAVKLTSGDPTWRHLTALQFHYQTQPLPPWTAWYADHLPGWFQRLSVVVMFAIEGLAPFLILTPRRLRFAGAWMLIGLQSLIIVTGNYGFFNLLAIALCVLLFDDGVWAGRRAAGLEAAPAPPARRAPASVRAAAVVLFVLSLVPLFGALRWPVDWMGPVPTAYALAGPLRTVNPYGLFAVMTTQRHEIVVEGSADGSHWQPYEFRWKPGDVTRRPAFMAPHMPRLDWQMWFAALGDWRGQSWFLFFCQRLLEGAKPVTALLARDPFPSAPPRYVRAVVYDYRFTDAATRARTGAWWSRERLGLYCPVLTLEGGRLTAVSDGVPAAP
jgi:predicted DCC family thiol-disulfide oxidoreductase YuxK